jgi:hypothetical protein
MSLGSVSADRYWEDWHSTWRFRDDLDPFMARQRDVALAVATSHGRSNLSILDAGCGTGWLGNALTPFGAGLGDGCHGNGRLGRSASLSRCDVRRWRFLRRSSFPTVRFDCDGRRVSAFRSCASRSAFATLLAPNGTLLLMTQNPFVWSRRQLEPFPSDVPNGRLDQWPTRRQILALLAPHFTVSHVTTLDPGGDRGVLWWVERRRVCAALHRLIGRQRFEGWLECAGLGWELVFIAR